MPPHCCCLFFEQLLQNSFKCLQKVQFRLSCTVLRDTVRPNSVVASVKNAARQAGSSYKYTYIAVLNVPI